VALEALRGELTTAQLASKQGIDQTMVGEWKKQAMDGLTPVFSGRSEAELTAKSTEAEVEKLQAKIGQLLVERDFLAKAIRSMGVERRQRVRATMQNPDARISSAYSGAKQGRNSGRTVDFRLSARRDVAAAKAFFREAIKRQQRPPQTITLDGYAASHRAVRELKADGPLPADMKLRSSKYLNSLIEQGRGSVKQRIAVMIGFKRFTNAAITITGIEFMHRIRKGQFALARLGVQGQAVPTIWNIVLTA
jgi:transposase-like protein